MSKGPLASESLALARVLDLTKKPAAVTVPFEGKLTFYGIVDVTADRISVCGEAVDPTTEANPELQRPRRFDSKDGLLLICERVQP